jgi:simple sugar transport system ATP-binding protein
MAFVPSNRLYRGVSLEASVRDNLLLSRRVGLHRWGWELRRPITAFVGHLLEKFGVKTDHEIPIGYLSGGNIQKVILARELSAGKDFGLFSEPTWGIDAASTEFVHNEILALRDRGCAILLISTDLDEILALSDRVAVMHRGSIVADYPNTQRLSKESIGLAMLGGLAVLDSSKDGITAPRPNASPEQGRC